MKLISHRGNLNGPNPEKENHPDYIKAALNKWYGVEVDVWYIDGKYVLGHDSPSYEVDHSFIKYNSRLWCHAKNLDALNIMSKDNYIHYFWHQKDDYTITSKNIIWGYPGKKLISSSVAVLPELANYSDMELLMCRAICTDYVIKYNKELLL